MSTTPKPFLNRLFNFFLNLTLIILIFSSTAFSQGVSTQIKINQLGFYPKGPKIAIVTGDSASSTFYITSANLRDTVYKGNLSPEKKSAFSSLITRSADFSSLTTEGNYFVCIPGIGHSYVFEINNNANRPAAIGSLKGYFYQRVSMPLEEKYAGKWNRSAGHPDTVVYIHPSAASAKRPAGTIISTPGGWYDAGD